MLSIGWTEMMLVAAIALIVVGPKDLPAMLRQIGKVVGSVRKMGNEFKAELNKVTAIDELKDIKQSIAAPLSETRRKIEEDFNAIAPDGSVVPSGKITPADPDAQSVVDEIRQGAGLEPLSQKENSGPGAARASMRASVKKTVQKNQQAANDVNELGAEATPALTDDGAKSAKKPASKPARKVTRKKPAKASKKPVAGSRSNSDAKASATKPKSAPKKPAAKKPRVVATKPSLAAKSGASVSKAIKSEAG
ncbi:MAG: Sec-independent protein translocase protein TatB [Devosiaceae bacterium]|nr:Sec-independent protein translocase protein TatB [Devosiaceae bacterium]